MTARPALCTRPKLVINNQASIASDRAPVSSVASGARSDVSAARPSAFDGAASVPDAAHEHQQPEDDDSDG